MVGLAAPDDDPILVVIRLVRRAFAALAVVALAALAVVSLATFPTIAVVGSVVVVTKLICRRSKFFCPD